MEKRILRLALASALAIAFTLTMGRVTFGDPNDDCHRRLESDRARVDRDAAKHGQNSSQVSRDVARMDNDRNWCRSHHADWDHSTLDIGIYLKH